MPRGKKHVWLDFGIDLDTHPDSQNASGYNIVLPPSERQYNAYSCRPTSAEVFSLSL